MLSGTMLSELTDTMSTESTIHLQKTLQGCDTLELVNCDHTFRSVIYRGTNGDNQFILRYQPLVDTDVGIIINSHEVKNITINDRYHKYICKSNGTYDVTYIYPALHEDIENVMPKNKKRIVETSQMYREKVYPMIVKQKLDWVYNILDGKAEQQDILYENEYFVLMPDIKWDGYRATDGDTRQIDSLYCLAIVRDRQLKSIRDLDSQHIPLLESIHKDGMDSIQRLFGVKEEELRAYFHYHPTYWHLHVHFNLIRNRNMDISIDRSHSLLTVINNIKMKSDYYQNTCLEIIEKS